MTPESLAHSHCVPRKGREHALDDAEIARLLGMLPGWTLDAGRGQIEKSFAFDDFHRTMAFVNAVAFLAHREDHHPALAVHYGSCAVRFNTHDVGGLSATDFDCAAAVDALLPTHTPSP